MQHTLNCLFSQYSEAIHLPVDIYLLKVNNTNTRTRCEICSKLTIKTPERRRTTPMASFWCLYRSSRPEVFGKKVALRNFPKFTGKHLCQSLYNFIKKDTLAQVFSCKFCEIPKNTFFQKTPLVAASVFIFNSEHYFMSCSSISIVNFEHVIAGWPQSCNSNFKL